MAHALQVAGTCPPLAGLTIASQHITFAYRISMISVNFGPATDLLVHVHPFLCLDPSIPTAAQPAGNPLLTYLSQFPYILGDDDTFELPMDFLVETKGTWLKLWIVNADAFPHTVSAIFTLYELEAP